MQGEREYEKDMRKGPLGGKDGTEGWDTMR